MSQQAVSKHLAYLQRARLVRKRREGRKQICELTPEPIREVANWAEDYRRHWESAFGRLRGLLQRQADETESRKKGER
jgi:DNA-binding transcriptional ArsR family regulator